MKATEEYIKPGDMVEYEVNSVGEPLWNCGFRNGELDGTVVDLVEFIDGRTIVVKNPGTGIQYLNIDDGPRPPRVVPREEIEELARACGCGSNKYSQWLEQHQQRQVALVRSSFSEYFSPGLVKHV